jgi:hypothetical protein
MTKLSRFIIALLCAFSLHASPPPGMVVQTWHYDAQTHAVMLRVLNTSGKDITGWTIKIKETYDNGQTNEHEYSTDMLQGMISSQLAGGQPGEDTFQANTSQDIPIGVAHPVSNFESTITVVLYADKTGETTDQDAFDRMVSTRKVAASTMQKASEVIKKAMLTSPGNAHEVAATALDQIRAEWKAQHHTTFDLDTGLLEGLARDMRDAPKVAANHGSSVTDYLNAFVAEHDRRASAVSEHASITKIGGAK